MGVVSSRCLSLSQFGHLHGRLSTNDEGHEELLAQPSVLSHAHETPCPRGTWRRWANTGPISLASYGVTWRFLASPSSSDGASSDRFELASEGSIPFLGTRFPLQWSQFRFRWANTGPIASSGRTRRRGP